MKYSLDPVNRFIYTTDENNDFHSFNDCPAVIYLDTKRGVFMDHGKVLCVAQLYDKIIYYIEKISDTDDITSYVHNITSDWNKMDDNNNNKCRNSSNPYHECSDYCKQHMKNQMSSNGNETDTSYEESEYDYDFNLFDDDTEDELVDSKQDTNNDKDKKGIKKWTIYDDCRNKSNPYHECSDYCKDYVKTGKPNATDTNINCVKGLSTLLLRSTSENSNV